MASDTLLDKIDSLPPAAPTWNGDDVVRHLADTAWHAERVEQTVDGLKTEVRDKTGKVRYVEIHPAYHDGVKYVKAVPTVAEAAPEDPADYKSIGAMDKYGFAERDWIVGIKSRATGKQYLTRPYAVTRYDGKQSNDNITRGIYEYAQVAASFGQEEGRAARWGGVFRDVDIRAEVSDGGALAVQHDWRADAVTEAEWYGVIWEVDCLAAEYLALIQPDGPHDTRLQAYVTEDKRQCIVEYFPRDQFVAKDADGNPTGATVDVAHDYTTISGNLSAALELTADTTFYVTVAATLGTNNVTSSSTAGHEWVVKTDGDGGFRVNSTGTWNVSHGIFSSFNDDSVGQAIAGSSGSPAVGDQTVSYLLATGTGTTSITMSNWTLQYHDITNTAGIGWSASAAGRTLSLTNGTMSNNAINSASSAPSCFIGQYSGSALKNGAVSLTNVYVDATNVCNDSAVGWCFISQSLTAGMTATNCCFKSTGTHTGGVGLIPVDADASYVFTNCVFDMDVADATVRGLLLVYTAYTGAYTYTSSVSRCTFRNTGTGDGAYFAQTYGTVAATVIDSIFYQCDGASAVALQASGDIVTHTYNVYYGNTADAYEAIGATEQTGVNPQLGNLPAGATIAAGYAIPNGYAVGNMALEFDGSDTFDNLGIDETKYSATGYRYAGSKNITPGVQYELSAFPEQITVVSPNTGTASGGTSVTLTVRGMGAAQGTGAVTFDGTAAASYTSWADTSIVVTTPAHAAGAVNVVVTNYRGAVVTSKGGFTYEDAAPGIPVLVSPADAASDVGVNPTLDWNAAANATSYRVQLATEATFAVPIVDESGLTETEYTIP